MPCPPHPPLLDNSNDTGEESLNKQQLYIRPFLFLPVLTLKALLVSEKRF
jgi:hypothetical protein